MYSITPIIRIANYPDRLGPPGKSAKNSTKLTYLEITGYRIKYSTVSWLKGLPNQAWSKGLDAGKGKAIPVQGWTGPEGSTRLRLADFDAIGT
jgi:hypothetical protein